MMDRTIRILFAATLILPFLDVVGAASSASGAVCSIKAECELCTSSDMSTVAECEKTGKIETLLCLSTDGGRLVPTS